MTQQASNIVVAVDSELHVLQRRVAQLREIRRLALELDHTPQPTIAKQPAVATPRRRQVGKQSALLTAADVVDVARNLLTDGPTTVGKILDRLGRSRTQRASAAVQDALAQLGATVAGRARGGGDLYTLAHNEQQPGQLDPAELLAKVCELGQSAVGWSDEEFRYQLRKRCGIQAPLDAVRQARRQLNGATS